MALAAAAGRDRGGVAYTITIDRARGEVTVEVIESFDRRVGFALWQYCEPESNGYRSFVLDLARVRAVSDAARNWLTGFTLWAQEHGAELRVIQPSAAIPALSRAAPEASEAGSGIQWAEESDTHKSARAGRAPA